MPLIVALQQWELHLPNCQSLKERRSVVAPLKRGLQRHLNLSVAEIDGQDTWQRARIACVVVGMDQAVIEETLRAADRRVEAADGVRIMDVVTEYR